VTRTLNPTKEVRGSITVGGDKSIAHRVVLISLLSQQPIDILNFPDNADCLASLNAVQVLGVQVEHQDDRVRLQPPASISVPVDTIIDCGNSGTTARLLAGIIAGSNLEVTLAGDESLQSRPMQRIIDPLTAMGAEFFADDGHLPMRIRGNKLLPFEYTLPVASAQVKSAIMLAALASGCSVTVRETVVARDHTEIMLEAIGEGITRRKITPVPVPDPIDPRRKRMHMPEPFRREISLSAQAKINGGTVNIPGDFSTAAYFFAAAAIARGRVEVRNVGLNPTRTAFLDYLKMCGCTVNIANKTVVSGETRGDVTVTGAKLSSRKIVAGNTVNLIDELPIVAVVAAFAEGTTLIRDAAELKLKESDRLASVSENLTLMGVKHGLLEDGLAIEGGRDFSGADFKNCGDHRIAMAFSVASLFLIGPSSIEDDEIVRVSCPNFYELLDEIAR
jgi:3-phosphoshikimate 1-carboxyvinyltransferase